MKFPLFLCALVSVSVPACASHAERRSRPASWGKPTAIADDWDDLVDWQNDALLQVEDLLRFRD